MCGYACVSMCVCECVYEFRMPKFGWPYVARLIISHWPFFQITEVLVNACTVWLVRPLYRFAHISAMACTIDVYGPTNAMKLKYWLWNIFIIAAVHTNLTFFVEGLWLFWPLPRTNKMCIDQMLLCVTFSEHFSWWENFYSTSRTTILRSRRKFINSVLIVPFLLLSPENAFKI